MSLEKDINFLLEKGEIEKVNIASNLDEKNLSVFVGAERYPKRRSDGMTFSDKMNARLNAEDLPDSIKYIIDTHFAQTQFFLEGGKWKSAQREIIKLQPIPHPTESGQYILSPELISEIKQNIDGYVANSYE